jgi:hypothetical protein
MRPEEDQEVLTKIRVADDISGPIPIIIPKIIQKFNSHEPKLYNKSILSKLNLQPLQKIHVNIPNHIKDSPEISLNIDPNISKRAKKGTKETLLSKTLEKAHTLANIFHGKVVS